MKTNLKVRILGAVLAIIMVLSSVPFTVFAGEVEKVAKIGTTEYSNLHDALEQCEVGQIVELLCNVDLKGVTWTPITGFKGTLDGKGYTISNLTVSGTSNVGFIGGIYDDEDGATVQNVTFDNANVTSTKGDYVAVVVGNGKRARINNVVVKNSSVKSAGEYVGAITGGAYSTIDRCTVENTKIEGVNQVGGVIGYDCCENITNCKVVGCTIKATEERAGGLVGKLQLKNAEAATGPDQIVKCNGNTVSNTIVISPENAGGLTGQLMGDDAYYEIKNNSIDVNFKDCGTTNPIGNLRAEQDEAFTAALSSNITGNWWSNTTLNSYHYEYSKSEVGDADAQEIQRCQGIKIGSQGYDTLDLALAAVKNGDTISLEVGTFESENVGQIANLNGKAFSIIGKGSNCTTFNIGKANTEGEGAGDYRFEGATVTFEDMKIQTKNRSINYIGFVRTEKLTFNNCLFYGRISGWGKEATINNSVFDSEDLYEYVLWTWGSNLTINNTIFNTQGKAIKLYGSSSSLTVKDCVFNSNGKHTGANKPAITVASKDYGSEYHITISNCTQSGFVKGEIGNELWGTDTLNDIDTSKTLVVNDVQIYPEVDYVAQIGNTKYSDLATALSAAQANETVELLCDVDLDGVTWTPITGFKGTFDGKGYTISNLTVSGTSSVGFIGSMDSNGGTIKNVTFDNATVTATGNNAAVVIGSGFKANILNVTVKNSSVTSTGEYVAGISGGAYSTITNCTVQNTTIKGTEQVGGIGGYIAGENITGCTVSKCTIEATSERVGGLVGKYELADSAYTVICNGNTVTETTVKAPKNAGGLIGQIMGSDADYEVKNNSVDVTFDCSGATNPIATLRDGQNAAFTGALSTNITGNWWTDTTKNANSYKYTNVASGVDPQTIVRGVAMIGETAYKTFNEAFTAAQDGDTITLLVDVNIEDGLTVNKNLTIDGDNHKLTYTGNSLSIFYFNATNKVLTIKNFEFHNQSTTSLYGIVNIASKSTGKIAIDHCTFADDIGYAAAIVTHDSRTDDVVTVEFTNNIVNEFFGGLFPYTREGSKFVDNEFNCIGHARVISPITNENSTDAIVVTGNKFVGCTKNGVISLNKSNAITKLEIHENNFVNCNNAIIVETTAEFTANSEITNTTGGAIIVDNNGSDTNGVLTITGGTYIGKDSAYTKQNNGVLSISGGTFSSKPDASDLAVGCEENGNGSGAWSVSKTKVAQIGEKQYETLQAAIDDAQDGDTIKVIANIIGTSNDPLAKVDGKTLTINLNGMKLEGYGCDAIIYALNKAVVTIKGNGTIVANECTNCGNDGYAMAVWAKGANTIVNIENGTFSNKVRSNSDQYDLIYAANGATINIKGGTYSSVTPKWTLNLQDSSNSTINVTGGTFTACNPETSNVETNDPKSFVANDYYSSNNNNGTWTVKKQDTVVVNSNPEGNKDVIVKTEMGDTSVTNTKPTGMSDDDKTSINSKTVVSGVELSKSQKTVTDGQGNKVRTGLQEVIEKAKAKSNEEFNNAIEANANKVVNVKVDVKVDLVATDYQNVDSQKSITFDLTPTATVSVTTGGVTKTVDGVEVTNDMIDQSQDIYVDLYTGFAPTQIVHMDNNNNVIGVFNQGDFTYNEETGVATVKIHHFSQLKALGGTSPTSVTYVAEIVDGGDNNKFETLTDALNAATIGQTVKLLANVKDQNIYVIVESGITLDLNGFSIPNAKLIYVTGNLVDTAASKGIINSKAYMFASTETYLPIYDKANNGYSMFDMGVDFLWKDSKVMFAFKNTSDRSAALALMNLNADNSRMKAIVSISWSQNVGSDKEVMQVDIEKTFAFNDSVLEGYVASNNATALYAKVSGLDGISNYSISAKFVSYDASNNRLFEISNGQ